MNNKGIKYFAIGLAIFLILLIISGCIYGLSYVYSFVTDKEEIVEVQPTKYMENEIKSLDINLSASNLKITKGDNNTLDTNNKYVNLEIKDGILYIKEEKHHFYKNNKFEVNITLKDTIYDYIKFETGAGKFNIDSLKTNNLIFNFGVGSGVINNLEVYNNAKIESGVGSVKILNGELNNLDLNTGIGKFLINSDIKGISKIDAGIGDLTLNLKQLKDNYKISLDKGIGSIYIDGEKNSSKKIGDGYNTLDIDGGIGKISLNFDNIIKNNDVVISILEYFKNSNNELILVGKLEQGKILNGMDIELYQNEELIKKTILIDETNKYSNKTLDKIKKGDKVYIKINDIEENVLKNITKIKSVEK